MGTSRNDRSPDVPSWKPALVALGNLNIPPERQLQEVWRAAIADKGELLRAELSSGALPAACDLVTQKISSQDALARFSAVASERSQSSFFVDLVERSLLRAVGSHASASEFAADVFSELTGYYVSRDLSSFIGAKNRVATPSQALQLKQQLKGIARDAALEAAADVGQWTTRAWSRYSTKVLAKLASIGGGHE